MTKMKLRKSEIEMLWRANTTYGFTLMTHETEDINRAEMLKRADLLREVHDPLFPRHRRFLITMPGVEVLMAQEEDEDNLQQSIRFVKELLPMINCNQQDIPDELIRKAWQNVKES